MPWQLLKIGCLSQLRSNLAEIPPRRWEMDPNWHLEYSPARNFPPNIIRSSWLFAPCLIGAVAVVDGQGRFLSTAQGDHTGLNNLAYLILTSKNLIITPFFSCKLADIFPLIDWLTNRFNKASQAFISGCNPFGPACGISRATRRDACLSAVQQFAIVGNCGVGGVGVVIVGGGHARVECHVERCCYDDDQMALSLPLTTPADVRAAIRFLLPVRPQRQT